MINEPEISKTDEQVREVIEWMMNSYELRQQLILDVSSIVSGRDGGYSDLYKTFREYAQSLEGQGK